MNKRIKELLYEAGGQYGGKHFTTGQDVIYTEEVDYEKFAELIVRECMQVSMKAVEMDAEYEAWYLIKQHFGVSK